LKELFPYNYSTVTDDYIISLPNSVDLESLTINSAYTFPTGIGLENQILSVGAGSNLVWSSGGGASGVNSVTAGDSNIVIGGSASNPTVELASQITLANPSNNSYIIIPANNASYTKIGTDVLTEETIGAQVLCSNEDRDVYASLNFKYNTIPAQQDAELILMNTRKVSI
jgi:hypothetical protein